MEIAAEFEPVISQPEQRSWAALRFLAHTRHRAPRWPSSPDRLTSWNSNDARPLVPVEGNNFDRRPAASPERLAAARKAEKLRRELKRQNARLTEEGAGLVGELGKVLGLLSEWGYQSDWSLRAHGEALRVIYNDLDLLLVEAIVKGLFTGLDPAELAAFASAFVYEPRMDDDTETLPTPVVEDRWSQLNEMWSWLSESENAQSLPRTRQPEAGFANLVYHWAKGIDLDVLLEDDDMAAGDFVRNCRQVLDLTRQLRDAAPVLGVEDLITTARLTLEAVDRGVVAAGGAA